MKNVFFSLGCFFATMCVAFAQSPVSLQFTNDVLNRKIVLYDWTGQEHQYAGFGINPGVFRYQVPDVSNSHVFYAATSGSSSRELFRITGQGNVGIGTATPTAQLQVDVAQAGNVNFPGLALYNTGSGQNWSGALSFQSPATSSPFFIYSWDDELQFSQRYANGTYKSHFMVFKNQTGHVVFPNATGNVGIGTETPTAKLQVVGTVDAQGFTINGQPIAGGSSQWASVGGSNTIAYTTANAKVGIGTTNPGSYTLAVAGKIGSWGEVRVLSLNAPFPDYVFAPDYQLRPLNDVASYIAQHRHLPEVPSAKEVEEKGLGLSEMQLISMKKIEELTLYLIDIQKQLNETQHQLQQVKEQNKTLEEKLHALETSH